MSYIVLISEEVQSKINRYTDLYADYYRKLYNDSGLGVAADIIIEQYIDITSRLNTLIHDTIEEALRIDPILGRFENTVNHTSIVTVSVNNRRLFLTYRDLPDIHTRILIDIEIVKK